MANPHFDISAAVVRQLGDELVSDEVTAIVELVKNAYDADATYAHVVVNTVDAPPGVESKFPKASGCVTIDDDGMGMDRADIERGWLMISLSGKRVMKAAGHTTPKGRTPLGDKGLGRLSTQKLGQNLELYTRKDGQAETLHVAFAWDAFTDDKSLSEVPVSIAPAAKSARNKGTLLVISELRNPEVWRGRAVEKLIADLSQIISPFAEARPFLVTLRIDGRPIDLGQVSAKVRGAAVGKFVIDFVDGVMELTGKFRLVKLRGNQDVDSYEQLLARDNGRAFFDYLKVRKAPVGFKRSDDPNYFLEFDYRLSLSALGGAEKVPSEEPDAPPVDANPGPFHAEIDEYLLRGDEVGAKLGGLANTNEVREIVQLHAGIKVFRDGFAIKPYGLNGEDWLRLSAQQTSASSYYGLRPQNVIGFVSISEAANGHLKEKTDREGFVSNPYSQNFRRLMIQAVDIIGSFYEWTRRNFNSYKAALPEQTKPFEGGRKAIADAENVARRLANYSKAARSLDANATAARQKITAVTTRIQQAPLLSTAAERELAGLLTEARQALEASQVLFSELTGYAAETKDLADIVAVLSPRLDVLADQLQDFSELAGLGLLAEALSHEVQNQTDRLMQKASAAVTRAKKSAPPNVDLLVFGQDVTAAASALRRQIGHLSPSLRYQRDKIETFQVSRLIEDIREHFSDRWADSGIQSEIASGSADFAVKTNRGRLTQVIDNVVLNAEYWLKEAQARETDFEPKLTIAYVSPRLRIWDNAGGVDPAVEDALFEPFITLKPKDEGRGLGLFISAQILESMGCAISLLSERNKYDRRYIFELDLSGIVDG
ncbi:sensor histidine kinase protein [Rhizobium sp. N541]|uniref:ATP-binding protein n=1 Tax=unclassified Rhizobium TaxID=2613769 RepID=UPI0007EE545F|nr:MULTISPECIES: ATP-binding protein [unclassified Rhizobium]ANM18246.1 sensor histidine kinase protein [Rhizobium sp. N541]ANM24632.1 sensor histidine kinase protein [Rhizobium sp. N941]